MPHEALLNTEKQNYAGWYVKWDEIRHAFVKFVSRNELCALLGYNVLPYHTHQIIQSREWETTTVLFKELTWTCDS